MSFIHGLVAAMSYEPKPRIIRVPEYKKHWYVRVPILVKIFPCLEWRLDRLKPKGKSRCNCKCCRK